MAKAAKTAAPAKQPDPPQRQAAGPSDAEIDVQERLDAEAAIDEIPGQAGTEFDRSLQTDREEIDLDTPHKPAVDPTPASRKPTAPNEDKKPEEAKTKDDDKRPEYLKKLAADLDKIQPPPGNSKAAEGYQALKGKITETGTHVVERDETIKTLKDEVEELKKRVIPEDQINNWKAIERQVELTAVESLPKWAEYDKAIDSISNTALDFLKKNGISEQKLKIIEDRGGVVRFANSEKKAGSAWKNPDNSPMTEAQWFKSQVFAGLDDMQRAEFSQLTASAYQKQREKVDAIEDAKKRAPEMLAAERETNMKTFNTRANAALKQFQATEMKEMGLPEEPPTVPEDGTPEEKAEAQRLLDAWTEGEKYIKENILVNSPEDRANVVVRAAFSNFLKTENKRLTKELADARKRAEAAEGKIEGIRKSRQIGSLRNASIVEPNDKVPDHAKTDEEVVGERFG